MTRDQVLNFAKDAGLVDPSPYIAPWPNQLDAWERFAALVGAAEREACAQIVRSECIGFAAEDEQLNCIVAAIRARSIQPPRVGD